MLSSWKKIPQIKRHAIVGAIICLGMLIYSFFAVDSVLDFMSRTVIMMLFASALNIILGFGGLVGAQRTELMEGIFGIRGIASGEIYMHGKKLKIKHPIDAMNAGIGLITEDRRGNGIFGCLSIKDNVGVSIYNKYLKAGFVLDHKKMNKVVDDSIKKLSIKTPSMNEHISNLSGGNQQKVVIGKWVNTDAEIFIFDEPTRGIDVGAKVEVYNVMNSLVKQGKCVIMVSSEMPEILGMSDRVIVMRGGEVMAEVDRDSEHFNQEDLMKAAWGGKLDD